MPVLSAAVAYEPATVGAPRRLVEDSCDQGAAQRERQRALHEHEGEQTNPRVCQYGQCRPAHEQQRTADSDDET